MPIQNQYPVPNVSVDIVLFTLVEGHLCVLLSRRVVAPFKGSLALPGGYVHEQEDDDIEITARRALKAKVGIDSPYMEQLQTFSGKFRDPRGWSISVAYYAVVAHEQIETENSGSLLVSVDNLPALPFDHRAIIEAGVRRLRNKSSYSSLPMFLLPEEFTLRELHEVYESVMDISISIVSFRRRMEMQNMIVAVEGAMRIGQHRPAQLFRRDSSVLRELEESLTK